MTHAKTAAHVHLFTAALTLSVLLRADALPAQEQHRAMPLDESLAPYAGPQAKGVDNSSLYNKVMTGYQGWFLAKGDGYEPGFIHWGGVDQTPPRATVDLWPDLSEFDEDETFPTNFRYADGTPARVFSSAVRSLTWTSSSSRRRRRLRSRRPASPSTPSRLPLQSRAVHIQVSRITFFPVFRDVLKPQLGAFADSTAQSPTLDLDRFGPMVRGCVHGQ